MRELDLSSRRRLTTCQREGPDSRHFVWRKYICRFRTFASNPLPVNVLTNKLDVVAPTLLGLVDANRSGRFSPTR